MATRIPISSTERDKAIHGLERLSRLAGLPDGAQLEIN